MDDDHNQVIFIVDANGVASCTSRQDLGGGGRQPPGPNTSFAGTQPASEQLHVTPFCSACTEATISNSAGDLVISNFVGHMLYGWRGRCGRCKSVIKRLYICIFLVPIWPLARYRVIYAKSERNRTLSSGRRFYSRMLPSAVAVDSVSMDPRRNRFALALASTIIFGLILSVGGLALFLGPGLPHPGARAMCADQSMSPGDVCQEYRNGVLVTDGDVTYADEQYRVTHGHPIIAILAFVAALVGLVMLEQCIVGIICYRQGRRLPRLFSDHN